MANTKITKTNRSAAARSTARRGNNTSNSDMRFMALVAILAVSLVATIGVAVAAFSQDLHINGTAAVKSTNWSVHFDNLAAATKYGDAVEVTAPAIDTTTTKIETYEVNLKSPGDYIEYAFDIVNDGDVNAKIGSITMKTGGTSSTTKLTCTIASGGDATKAQATCGNLHYTLTWDTSSHPALSVNDPLPANAGASSVRRAKLKLELDSAMNPADLPDKDVTISDLGVVINFVQD